MDKQALLVSKLGRRKAERLIMAVGLELAYGIISGEQDKSLDKEAELVRVKAQEDTHMLNIREHVKEYAGRQAGDILVDMLGADYALALVTARPVTITPQLKERYEALQIADAIGARWREQSPFWAKAGRRKMTAADVATSVSLMQRVAELGVSENELLALIEYVGDIGQVEQILDILTMRRQ